MLRETGDPQNTPIPAKFRKSRDNDMSGSLNLLSEDGAAATVKTGQD